LLGERERDQFDLCFFHAVHLDRRLAGRHPFVVVVRATGKRGRH
jgi:hypothetical protein